MAAAEVAVAATVLSGGAESVDFLNDLIAQLWPYITEAAERMMQEGLEPMFKEMLPGPLKNLRFKKLDLGTTPIRLARADVHTRTKDSVKLDIDLVWDGNCDIEMSSGALGFGVEHVKIGGRLSVLMKPLVALLPPMGAIQVAFINPPSVELDFTGLAQIADVSFVRSAIRKLIDKIIAMLFVLPNRFLVKLNPANDYFKTYVPPMGFLRLTLVSGTGFATAGGFFKDVPDCYCRLVMGADEPWETTTKNNDNDPEWNESRDFLFSDHDQLIFVEVWDDDVTRDDRLGSALLSVNELLLAGKKKELPILKNGVEAGAKVTLACDIFAFSDSSSSLLGTLPNAKGLYCGMMTVIVACATDIREIESLKPLVPHVVIKVGKEEFATPAVVEAPGVDPRNPSFDSSFRVFLTPSLCQKAPDVKFELKVRKTKLGETTFKFNDVLKATHMTLRKDIKFDSGATLKVAVIINGTEHEV